MPFAENTRRITGFLKHLRDCSRTESHALSLEDRVGHAVLELVTATHDRRTRWRACWAYMEVRKPGTQVMQPIEMRCFQHCVSQTTQITLALIVGHDQNDIRPLPGQLGRCAPACCVQHCRRRQRPGTYLFQKRASAANHIQVSFAKEQFHAGSFREPCPFCILITWHISFNKIRSGIEKNFESQVRAASLLTSLCKFSLEKKLALGHVTRYHLCG
jgi:hypothetical protein